MSLQRQPRVLESGLRRLFRLPSTASGYSPGIPSRSYRYWDLLLPRLDAVYYLEEYILQYYTQSLGGLEAILREYWKLYLGYCRSPLAFRLRLQLELSKCDKKATILNLVLRQLSLSPVSLPALISGMKKLLRAN